MISSSLQARVANRTTKTKREIVFIARTERGSSALPPVQAHEPPSFALVRPGVGMRPRQIGETLLLFEYDAPRRARGGFRIVGQSLCRRAAPRGKPKHFKFPHNPLQRQAQSIADAHPVRRLDAFAIEMNLAAVDG